MKEPPRYSCITLSGIVSLAGLCSHGTIDRAHIGTVRSGTGVPEYVAKIPRDDILEGHPESLVFEGVDDRVTTGIGKGHQHEHLVERPVEVPVYENESRL